MHSMIHLETLSTVILQYYGHRYVSPVVRLGADRLHRAYDARAACVARYLGARNSASREIRKP